jgi:hypothetical protein
MPSRPRLKPPLQPLRRGGGAVQLGLDPALGVVIDGLTEAEVELLERLDGTLDEAAALAWARERGISAQRFEALLTALRGHRLTVESPTARADLPPAPGPVRPGWGADAEALACAYRHPGDGLALLADRSRRHVVVDGGGTLPQAIAAALCQGGVGRVRSGRYAASAGDAAHPPDLVVLTAVGALDPARAAGWMRDGVTHLPVLLHGTRAEVGPLVTPRSGPCLRCLDLTRTDLDPAWPAVLAQLTPAGVAAPRDASGETSLVQTAAGLAAMLALGALDGAPPSPGLALEVGLAAPHLGERRWPVHAACPCAQTEVAASGRGAPGTPAAREGAAPGAPAARDGAAPGAPAAREGAARDTGVAPAAPTPGAQATMAG